MTSMTVDCGLPGRRRRIRPKLPGFTMIEAVVSMIVVALMLVAALNLVGASKLTQHRVALICRGRLLAEELMADLLRQGYHHLNIGTVEVPDGPAGWTQTATVKWIDPMDPQEVKTVETSAKRITVIASYKDVPQAALVAVRTEGL